MSQHLPDHDARERIRTDLQSNLIVEAGAGSGKTTALVGRLLEHVRTGTPVEQLAAVTFTRKAAEELRERFQLQLERAVRQFVDDAPSRERCATALRDLDRAFLGTIHAFCARLLRERPIEVGLDPGFSEIADADVEPMNRDFWRTWIDAARRLDDPEVQAMLACGIEPSDLHDAFAMAMQFHDVEFPSEPVTLPETGPVMAALRALMAQALELRALAPDDARPDHLWTLVQRLRFHESVHDWSDPMVACVLLESISEGQLKVVLKDWSTTTAGKAAAKALAADFVSLFTQRIAPVVQRWREYRYPIVMTVLRRAVADFARDRHERGTLGFDDLLLLCARLLREHPVVRNELGLRYRYLLVDEFQDTDPVQAEVCLLLASEASQGSDWQTVVPRPGALFVVGDPKQSIYRFRRADIQIYERVKARFADFGATLSLTANFRSTAAIGALVNDCFSQAFPATATVHQAVFSPLIPAGGPPRGATAGVFRYVVACETRRNDDLLEQDADLVAAYIAERIADGEVPGNFMVLTETKRPIAVLARALAARNIPVSTTGAPLTQEHELQELLLLLRALADPGNAVLVAAALEGLFFGLTPADLYAAHRRRTVLSIAVPAAAVVAPVEDALRTLHRWWQLSRQHSADILIERILDDTGLLMLAAGSVLGDARAGALLHLVQVVRDAATMGRSSLTDAIALLETVLEAEAPDTPLRPGRTDAVRVMNLHKAKGLEAEIVILAAPTDRRDRAAQVHVTRAAHGAPTGGLLVSVMRGSTSVSLAQPVGWDAMQVEEAAFRRGEEDRLRYVAATRARRALVIAEALKPGKTPKPDASMWRALADAANAGATSTLAITVSEPPGRQRLALDPAQVQQQADAAAARVALASVPSSRVQTVTGIVKGEDAHDEPSSIRSRDAALRWGTAVHACLDALVRGRRGASLQAFIAATIASAELEESDAASMTQLVAQVERSTDFAALVASGTAAPELSVMQVQAGDGQLSVTEGVIDMAIDGTDGWVVVDWKSDSVDAEGWARALEQYTAQVNRYAAMLTGITGAPASGRVVRVGQS